MYCEVTLDGILAVRRLRSTRSANTTLFISITAPTASTTTTPDGTSLRRLDSSITYFDKLPTICA